MHTYIYIEREREREMYMGWPYGSPGAPRAPKPPAVIVLRVSFNILLIYNF